VEAAIDEERDEIAVEVEKEFEDGNFVDAIADEVLFENDLGGEAFVFDVKVEALIVDDVDFVADKEFDCACVVDLFGTFVLALFGINIK
jgi:hypothetical protein